VGIYQAERGEAGDGRGSKPTWARSRAVMGGQRVIQGIGKGGCYESAEAGYSQTQGAHLATEHGRDRSGNRSFGDRKNRRTLKKGTEQAFRTPPTPRRQKVPDVKILRIRSGQRGHKLSRSKKGIKKLTVVKLSHSIAVKALGPWQGNGHPSKKDNGEKR